MKRKTYTGSFKARVVADLLQGRRELNELADLYQLHPNQIKNWKTILFKRAHLVLDDRRHYNNKANNGGRELIVEDKIIEEI